jgi:hypothetical protein
MKEIQSLSSFPPNSWKIHQIPFIEFVEQALKHFDYWHNLQIVSKLYDSDELSFFFMTRQSLNLSDCTVSYLAWVMEIK